MPLIRIEVSNFKSYRLAAPFGRGAEHSDDHIGKLEDIKL